MHCKEAQRKSSAYLDGELGDEQSSAVRGHLRQCQTCEHLFEEESAFIELASSLEPLEPTDHVWEQISKRIAEEEIADSDRPSWRRWLTDRRLLLGGFGVAVCATAAVALVVSGDATSSQTLASGTGEDAGSLTASASVDPQTVAQETTQALSDADRNYQETIAELREMLEEDRASWSAEVALAVDAKLAHFRRSATRERFAVGDATLLVASRDPIYATYREEISFLQSALAGELPRVGGMQ